MSENTSALWERVNKQSDQIAKNDKGVAVVQSVLNQHLEECKKQHSENLSARAAFREEVNDKIDTLVASQNATLEVVKGSVDGLRADLPVLIAAQIAAATPAATSKPIDWASVAKWGGGVIMALIGIISALVASGVGA